MIKYYTHDMPALGNLATATAGSLIAIMDNLCTGFGDVTPTAMSVTAGVGTMTVPSGHSFIPHSVAELAVSGRDDLTGEFKVLTSGTTLVTFACPAATAGVVSGTLAARIAGAGLTKAFTGTNKGVYRFSAPEAGQAFLRIDDSNTTARHARHRMYENMTDVDTGTNPGPSDAMASGGGYLKKGEVTGNSKFWIMTDGLFLHFFNTLADKTNTGYQTPWGWCFGDIKKYRNGDAFPTVLWAAADSTSNVYNHPFNSGAGLSSYCIMRPNSGIGGALWTYSVASAYGGGVTSGGPSPQVGGVVEDRLFLFPRWIVDGASLPAGRIRGEIPGYLHSCQTLSAYPETGTVIDGTGNYEGRKLVFMSWNPSFAVGTTATGGTAFVLFDLTGPWR